MNTTIRRTTFRACGSAVAREVDLVLSLRLALQLTHDRLVRMQQLALLT